MLALIIAAWAVYTASTVSAIHRTSRHLPHHHFDRYKMLDIPSHGWFMMVFAFLPPIHSELKTELVTHRSDNSDAAASYDMFFCVFTKRRSVEMATFRPALLSFCTGSARPKHPKVGVAVSKRDSVHWDWLGGTGSLHG